jgi:Fe-S-cluster containining protein
VSHAEAGQLDVIYLGIAHRVGAAIEERPLWPCRRGCDACCRRLANPPEMTAAEWRLLYRGLLQLPAAAQEVVAAQIMALSERAAGPGQFVTCPFLDQEQGACRVYEFRPAACRMYGFYVSRDGNQWCNDIQALYEAGELEGVILGNHSAVNRELARCFGEVKPLDVWYQAERESEGM